MGNDFLATLTVSISVDLQSSAAGAPWRLHYGDGQTLEVHLPFPGFSRTVQKFSQRASQNIPNRRTDQETW